MANLAPNVQPTNDPNYIYWSREIQQPEADKSGQYRWTSAGQALEAGAKGAFTTVENNIDQTLDKALTPVVQQETQDLQSYYDHITGNQPELPDWAKMNQSGQIPPGLQRLPDQLESVQSRRQNGNISETHYIGQVLQIAKDFRNTYDAPAFKQLIDEQTHRITGIRSANAEIQGLLSDINSYNSGKDKFADKIVNEMITQGVPNGMNMIQEYREGKRSIYDLGQTLEAWVSPYKAAERSKAQIENVKAQGEEASRLGEGPFGSMLHGIAKQSLNTVFAQHVPDPQNPGGFKNMGIDELFANNRLADGVHLSDQQWNQMGMATQSAYMLARSQMYNRLDEQTTPGGLTWRQILGDAKANEMVTRSLSYIEGVQKAITDKDFGTAHQALRDAHSFLEDGMPAITQNPDLGRVAKTMFMGTQIGGPNNVAWANGMNESYIKGIKGISNTMRGGLFELLGQPSSDLRPTISGPPTLTLSQHMSSLQNPPPGQASRTPGDQTKIATYVANEPTSLWASVRAGKQNQQAGINMARAVFGDPNSIDNFTKSQVEKTGFQRDSDGVLRQHTTAKLGQTEVFANWTSPEVAKQMHDYGSETWNMYKNWTSQTGSRLFMDDLGQINSIAKSNKNVAIAWDGDHQRFVAYPKANVRPTSPSGMPIGQADTTGPRRAVEELQPALDRYTPLLKSWATIAKIDGQDPNAFVLSTLRNNGVNLGAIAPLATAIKAGAMQFAPDEEAPRGQTASEFMKNPMGAFKQPDMTSPRPNSQEEEIIPGKPIDIPEGVSPRDFIKTLRSQGKL